MEERRRRLWAALAAEQLDGLVVAARGVIGEYGPLQWSVGYVPVVRAACAVLVPTGAPILLVPTVADAWFAGRRTELADVRVVARPGRSPSTRDLTSSIVQVLRELGIDKSRIGVVGEAMLTVPDTSGRLGDLLPGATVVDVTATFARVKADKTGADVHEMTRTAAIVDDAFERFALAVRPGATGWELNGLIEHSLRSDGARESLVYLSSGPHYMQRPTDAPLRRGDLLTAYIEVAGPTGYWVEFGRLVAVGPIDAERTRIADRCLAAAAAAARELRAGVAVATVAQAMDDALLGSGLCSGLLRGHGVGVDHDPPEITLDEDSVLRPSTTLAVHPALWTADGRLGASVADTYVIGANDQPPRRLSRIEPGLTQCDLTC